MGDKGFWLVMANKRHIFYSPSKNLLLQKNRRRASAKPVSLIDRAVDRAALMRIASKHCTERQARKIELHALKLDHLSEK
jgi:hypothetical protein